MIPIRGVVTSVGYADVLAITLCRNMRHMVECWVATSPEDEATQAVARSVPGVHLHITDAFTRHGARFNKSLAFEEAFDAMGREGWILIWDADTLFPDSIDLRGVAPDQLYGMSRKVLEDISQWTPDFNWNHLAPARNTCPLGFFQLFHADDPAIRDKRPWYDVSFGHAGGGDAYFFEHWPKSRRAKLPREVLHLGPTNTNWFGTDEASKDLMARFAVDNYWHRAVAKLGAERARRAGEVPHRVSVPGYAPSTYELPFVRNAQARR